MLSEKAVNRALEEAQPPSEEAGALLRYLDERLCVPRDLGAPSAAAIRALAQPAES